MLDDRIGKFCYLTKCLWLHSNLKQYFIILYWILTRFQNVRDNLIGTPIQNRAGAAVQDPKSPKKPTRKAKTQLGQETSAVKRQVPVSKQGE